MSTILLQKTFIFNTSSFPTVFNKQSKIFINFIYNHLLEKKPNITHIKIKLFFFDNTGKEFKEMFFFKERPNKISGNNFHYLLIESLCKFLKNKDLENFFEYKLVISYSLKEDMD